MVLWFFSGCLSALLRKDDSRNSVVYIISVRFKTMTRNVCALKMVSSLLCPGGSEDGVKPAWEALKRPLFGHETNKPVLVIFTPSVKNWTQRGL